MSSLRPIARERVFRRDKYTCVYCNRSSLTDGVKLHADHLVPVLLGGSNKVRNIVTACSGCNLAKRAELLTTPERRAIRATVRQRNAECGIEEERIVTGVRVSNPRKIVSIRLSEQEEDYCKVQGNGNVGGFIRSLIAYHRQAEIDRGKLIRNAQTLAKQAAKSETEANTYRKALRDKGKPVPIAKTHVRAFNPDDSPVRDLGEL